MIVKKSKQYEFKPLKLNQKESRKVNKKGIKVT